MASTFNARDAAVYERSMGRWSRQLAPGLVAFSGIAGSARVLDVGCGTGSLLLELASNPARTSITGIDASDIYATAARARTQDPRVAVHHGDACAMPFPDAGFDAALSQLVLQFVPDPGAAVSEMRRVVRPGGTVAAAVWNSGGGMPHQRMFWDTAAMLDPTAAEERGRAFTRPMTRRGDLQRLFGSLGLVEVEESSLTIWMEFESFADFWDPIAGGEGTLGKYVDGLPSAAAERLQAHLRTAYASGAVDGPRQFACTAAVCRGIVPPSSYDGSQPPASSQELEPPANPGRFSRKRIRGSAARAAGARTSCSSVTTARASATELMHTASKASDAFSLPPPRHFCPPATAGWPRRPSASYIGRSRTSADVASGHDEQTFWVFAPTAQARKG